MFSEKNERTALLIATVIFALVGIGQLCRAITGTAVTLGSLSVPIWLSVIIGLLALFMAYWLGGFFRRRGVSR